MIKAEDQSGSEPKSSHLSDGRMESESKCRSGKPDVSDAQRDSSDFSGFVCPFKSVGSLCVSPRDQRDPTRSNGSQREPTRSSQSQARSIRTVSASDSIRCRLLDLQSSISRANVSLARLSLPSLGAWRDRKQVARLHLAPRLRLFALASMASIVLSALPLPSVVRSVVCSTQSHKREPSEFTSEY